MKILFRRRPVASLLLFLPLLLSNPIVAFGATLLTPSDFTYLGAFRLPQITSGGSHFGNGGYQMALNPNGNPGGPSDGFPGSLLISGHVRDQKVAEVAIPIPVNSPTKNTASLPIANALHSFVDVTGGLLNAGNLGEMSLGGIHFFDGGNGTKLYWTRYLFYNVSGANFPTHGCSNPNLDSLNTQGMWYLGNHSPQMTAGFIFNAPQDFAVTYLGGKQLISGLDVSQGLATTSNGPAMFAYAPWQYSSQPPPNGVSLATTPLMYYPYENPDPEFKPCDEWRGGSWIASGDKQAVLIVGRKSLGTAYYGVGRSGDCTGDKGYHCGPYAPQVRFYNPDEFAAVARGQKQPWSIIPYQTWNLTQYFWQTCEYRVQGVDFDSQNGILYILQHGVDTVTDPYSPYPLVHVFRVAGTGGTLPTAPNTPDNVRVQ